MDDLDREIVRTWSALECRELEPTPVVIAEWLRKPVGDVEKRMRLLAGQHQLPGWVMS